MLLSKAFSGEVKPINWDRIDIGKYPDEKASIVALMNTDPLERHREDVHVIVRRLVAHARNAGRREGVCGKLSQAILALHARGTGADGVGGEAAAHSR